MCGRFSLNALPEDIAKEFELGTPPRLAPRYNIAPTQPVLAIREDNGGIREAVLLTWGLLPRWMKEPPPRPMINARAETVMEKPSFRGPFRSSRCLIPATGYYEWHKEGGKNQAYHITVDNGGLFAMAGLWEYWMSPDGSEAETCTILTIESAGKVAEIHHRMPVILPQETYSAWLSPTGASQKERLSMLRPFDDQRLSYHPVDSPRGV